MQLKIQNTLGTIEIGGSSPIRATRVSGLGVPAYERLLFTSYDFEGAHEGARRLGTRQIIIAGDLPRSRRESARIMRILSEPCLLSLPCAGREITANAAECDFSEYNNSYQKFVISLICDDPYFYDCEETCCGLYVRQKLITDDTVMPAVFSSRTDSAALKISGDRPAEPVIEILGGAKNGAADGSIVIENLTSGKKFTLLYVPENGERITIDTAARTAVSDLGGSIIKYLSADSFMSDLVIEPPVTVLRAAGCGATGSMSAYVKYKNKYLEAFV